MGVNVHGAFKLYKTLVFEHSNLISKRACVSSHKCLSLDLIHKTSDLAEHSFQTQTL
jgi:hypothetical protein